MFYNISKNYFIWSACCNFAFNGNVLELCFLRHEKNIITSTMLCTFFYFIVPLIV